MKISIKGLLLLTIVASAVTAPALADSYKSYDENIIRGYKTAKIQVLKPSIILDATSTDEAVDEKVYQYLSDKNYFKKKLKNKGGIFFIQTKESEAKNGGKSTKVTKLYAIKNPEKFMFAMNNKLTKKELSDREAISQSIRDNISSYAILSEKIDKKNSPFALKVLSAGYNGTLDAIILAPKLGFGYIFNPPFRWIKTDTPEHIYKNISSEIEDLSTGDKETLRVKYFKNDQSL